MKIFSQYFIFPVLIGGIGGFHFLYVIWDKLSEKTLSNLVKLPTFFSASALICIIIILSWLTYKEKNKDGKKGSIELRLRSAFNLNNISVETKDDNPINGMLSVRVDKAGKRTDLLQRQLCYEEFRNVGESIYKEEKPTTFNTLDSFKNSRLRIFFQPAARTFWTRSLYDKDDLKEYLNDAPVSPNGLRQVLIYTETLEALAPEFLTKFPDPSTVFRVRRMGGSVKNPNKLPLLFDVLTHIEVLVRNQKLAVIALNDKETAEYLNHHWAIGAILGRGIGIEKFSLYYGVEVAFEISRRGAPKKVAYRPTDEATSTFQKKTLEAAKIRNFDNFSLAMDELNKSYPKGFEI